MSLNTLPQRKNATLVVITALVFVLAIVLGVRRRRTS